MKVWPGNPAGLTHSSYHFTLTGLIPGLDIDPAHMTNHGYDSITVIYQNGIAIKKIVACRSHNAIPGSSYRHPLGTRNVETAVGISGLVVVEPAQAKAAGNRSFEGPPELGHRTDRFCPALIDAIHCGALFATSDQILLIRIYLPSIGNDQMLRFIFFSVDFNVDLLIAFHIQLLGPGFK